MPDERSSAGMLRTAGGGRGRDETPGRSRARTEAGGPEAGSLSKRARARALAPSFMWYDWCARTGACARARATCRPLARRLVVIITEAARRCARAHVDQPAVASLDTRARAVRRGDIRPDGCLPLAVGAAAATKILLRLRLLLLLLRHVLRCRRQTMNSFATRASALLPRISSLCLLFLAISPNSSRLLFFSSRALSIVSFLSLPLPLPLPLALPLSGAHLRGTLTYGALPVFRPFIPWQPRRPRPRRRPQPRQRRPSRCSRRRPRRRRATPRPRRRCRSSTASGCRAAAA